MEPADGQWHALPPLQEDHPQRLKVSQVSQPAVASLCSLARSRPPQGSSTNFALQATNFYRLLPGSHTFCLLQAVKAGGQGRGYNTAQRLRTKISRAHVERLVRSQEAATLSPFCASSTNSPTLAAT